MGQTPAESEQEIQHQESNILSLTPAKTNEPLNATSNNEGAKLPEKYKTLSELFDHMVWLLRLLSMAKKIPNFSNISRQVEVSTKRKFTLKHLAQMKFIFPEAVQVDRILIHNEKTLCMERDMKISLLFDAIEGHHEQSVYTAMQQMFSFRLFSYISVHPEDCEIPEAELPWPFNKRNITVAESSYLFPSFGGHFSTKADDVETEKKQLLRSEVPLSSARNDCMTNQDTGDAQQERSDLYVKSFMLKKPLQAACPSESYAEESTPMAIKPALENENLIIVTPAQATPKRSVSSDNKPKTAMSQKLLASSISAKRSLQFSHLEGDELFQASADAIEQIEGETKAMGQTPVESDQEIQHQESNILSLTPAQTNEPLNATCNNERAKLPEKCKALCELFECMISLLRLLTLGKKTPNFSNISTQVEVLTKRKFMFKHLAQMKFIFPEAVQVDRILIHNEKTLCMERDMKISLLFDAIEGHHEQSVYTAMQQMFCFRLFSYIRLHPEDCEIPEAELPWPFNKRNITVAESSYLFPSFGGHFSTKADDVETEKTQLLLSEVPLSSVRNDCMTNQDNTGEAQHERSDLYVKSFMLKKPLQAACPPESYAQGSTPMV